MKKALEKTEKVVASDSDRYVLLQQFKNPANPAIHEKTAGSESWDDADGTITGVSRYIKKTQGKAITSVTVEPVASLFLAQLRTGEPLTPDPHKIQGIGAGFVSDNLDFSLVDEVEIVSNEKTVPYARHLVSEEGILSDISCGAAVAAVVRHAGYPEDADKTLAVILPDSGERCLSSILFEDVFAAQGLKHGD